MRLNRGDRIAGVDGLRLRNYFRRNSENVNCRTLMGEFSMSKRRAQNVLDALRKLKVISPCEFQHDKKMVCYETTILGNALGMAKAGRPVKRASAGTVLRELLDRVKAVNDREDLAYRVESVVIFGSYLSGAKRVNDLDVAVELKPRGLVNRCRDSHRLPISSFPAHSAYPIPRKIFLNLDSPRSGSNRGSTFTEIRDIECAA